MLNTEQSPMAILLETPITEFLNYVSTLSLGELKSVSNFLKMEYERTNMIRKSLMDSLETAPEDKIEDFNKTLQDLMIIMQHIEDRVVILVELEKERVL